MIENKTNKKWKHLWAFLAIFVSLTISNIVLAGGYHWVQVAKLTASDAAERNYFGWSVSTSDNGDYIMTGAYGDDRTGSESNYGSAYIYSPRDDWGTQNKLYASDQVGDDYFGWSVAISGDGRFVVIGVPYKKPPSGVICWGDCARIYVFKRTGSSWSEVLNWASGTRHRSLFGQSVAISKGGNYIVVGAPYAINMLDDWFEAGGNGTYSGAAVVYHSTDDWATKTEYVLDGGAEVGTYDHFGWSVAIDTENSPAQYVIVGAHDDDESYTSGSGAAYVFKRSGSTWNLAGRLTASDNDDYDHFGYSTGISGKYAVIGAVGNDDGGSQSGSAYIFKTDGANWVQYDKLVADDADSGDQFGYSTAIYSYDTIFGGIHRRLDSGSTRSVAIVGAYSNDDAGHDSGSAYIFTKTDESWSQFEKLTASDAASTDRFGLSVSITRRYAVVGAHYNDDDGTNSGSMYIYHYEWDPNYGPGAGIELTTPFEDISILSSKGVYLLWNRGPVIALSVEYSLTGNSGPWIPAIGTMDPNIGDPNGFDPEGIGGVSFGWEVPALTNTGNCYIKVKNGPYESISGPFAIKQLILQTPRGGEQLHPGNTARIVWRSDDTITSVNLSYSTNGGGNWNPIATGILDANGFYDWVIPDANSIDCRIKISDADNQEVHDVSKPFAIKRPKITPVVIENFEIINDSNEPATNVRFTIGVDDEQSAWFVRDETTGLLKYEINITPNQRYPSQVRTHRNLSTGNVDYIVFDYDVLVLPGEHLNIFIKAELNIYNPLRISYVDWNTSRFNADINFDGAVDFKDVCFIAEQWLNIVPE